MAKKISKAWKRVLSILFHVLVLIGFIVLYDSGQAIYEKFAPKGGDSEEASEDGAKGEQEKKQGTTFADMLEQREKKRAAEKSNNVESGNEEKPAEESAVEESVTEEGVTEEGADAEKGE